jgi:hypothetical protein
MATKPPLGQESDPPDSNCQTFGDNKGICTCVQLYATEWKLTQDELCLVEFVKPSYSMNTAS